MKQFTTVLSKAWILKGLKRNAPAELLRLAVAPALESPLIARTLTFGVEVLRDVARAAPSRLGMIRSVMRTLISLLRVAKQRDRLGAVGRGQYPVAVAGEHGGRDVANLGLVVDDKDKLTVAALPFGGTVSTTLPLWAKLRRGQVYTRNVVPRPCWVFRLMNPSWFSTMLRTVERPRPVPFPSPFVVKKGLPDLRQSLIRDTRPGILDVKNDPGAGARPGNLLRHGLVQEAVFGAQPERAAVGHGVAGVDAEVEEHLVDLGGVGHDGPEVAREARPRSDVLREALIRHAQRLLEEVLDLDSCCYGARPVGEREDLAHELDAALGALLKGRDDPQVLRIGRVLPKDRRGEDDGGEDVVQVVGDPRRQHPDALQALGALELLVEALLGRRIGTAAVRAAAGGASFLGTLA
jgi:hypothetical protein